MISFFLHSKNLDISVTSISMSSVVHCSLFLTSISVRIQFAMDYCFMVIQVSSLSVIQSKMVTKH